MSIAALPFYYTLCFIIGLSSSLDVRTVIDANMKGVMYRGGNLVCSRGQLSDYPLYGYKISLASYLVSFGPNTTGRYIIDVECSGVLMTPKYIFTAAHCFYKPDGGKKDLKSLVLVAGSFKMQGFDDHREFRGFQEAWIHSEYKPMSFVNDLAIGEMDRDFNTRSNYTSIIRAHAYGSTAVGDFYWNNCMVAGFWSPRGPRVARFDCLRVVHRSSCNYSSGVKGALCFGYGPKTLSFREQGAAIICRAEGHSVVTGILLSSLFDRHTGKQWPSLYLRVKDYWDDKTVPLSSAPE